MQFRSRMKPSLCEYICKEDINAIRELLSQGTDVNVIEKFYMCTPLLASIQLRRYDIFLLLLTHGADVNMVNFNGYTPCHYAVHAGMRFMKPLISRGAVFDVKSPLGTYPHDWCSDKNTQMYLVILARVRSVCCYIIGIRKGTNKEGMGALGAFPKEIVRMIAHRVWVTRDDDEWI